MNNAIQIVELDEIAEKIDEVRDSANFLPDVTNKEGYEKSKRISLDVGKLLTALEKKRKEKKAYFLDGGKEVDKQAKSIALQLEKIQLPHKGAYQELDKLRKEREELRKSALEKRVSDIRNLPDFLLDSSSDEIKLAMESMHNEDCSDFYEFTEQALKARNTTREALGLLFVKRKKEEDDKAELDKLRQESEARAKKEREDEIAKQAREAAERKAEESKEAEKRAIEIATEAVKQKEEAEKRAKADAKEAEKRAEEDAKQAKIDAARQSKEAADKARKDQVEAQKRKEREEAEAQEARESDKRHIGNIRKQAKESLMKFVDEKTAKAIVMAIHAGEIKNVIINY